MWETRLRRESREVTSHWTGIILPCFCGGKRGTGKCLPRSVRREDELEANVVPSHLSQPSQACLAFDPQYRLLHRCVRGLEPTSNRFLSSKGSANCLSTKTSMSGVFESRSPSPVPPPVTTATMPSTLKSFETSRQAIVEKRLWSKKSEVCGEVTQRGGEKVRRRAGFKAEFGTGEPDLPQTSAAPPRRIVNQPPHHKKPMRDRRNPDVARG